MKRHKIKARLLILILLIFVFLKINKCVCPEVSQPRHYQKLKQTEKYLIIIKQKDSVHHEKNKIIDSVIVNSSSDSLYEFLKQYHGRNAKYKGFD